MRRKDRPSPPIAWGGVIKSYRPAHPRRWKARAPRRWGAYVLVFLGVVALLASSVFAYVLIKGTTGQKDLDVAGRASDEPINVLILGSDSREGLSKEELAKYDPEGVDRRTGRRADTVILLHFEEKAKRAVLVHFPRDLRVKYPDGKTGKINGVYQKGPDAMIETVSSFTGLPIHHYIEVNFTSFKKIVSALGGVSVYFERPIREPDSGLNVPKGCVKLDGDQALAFVRVRKIDDDFGRIGRQQLFIKLLMDKILSPGTLLNPLKIKRLADLFSENVTRDDNLSVDELRKLALRMKDFDSGSIDMRVVPSSGASIRGVSYVIANDKQAAALFGAMAKGDPLPDYGRTGVSAIDPSDVGVSVLNGTDVNGLAARAGEALGKDGFSVVEVGDADRRGYEDSIVFYKEGSEEKARFLAGPFGAEVKVLPASIVAQGPVVLVVGRDYAEGRATPPPPTPAGKAKAKPLVHTCDP